MSRLADEAAEGPGDAPSCLWTAETIIDATLLPDFATKSGDFERAVATICFPRRVVGLGLIGVTAIEPTPPTIEPTPEPPEMVLPCDDPFEDYRLSMFMRAGIVGGLRPGAFISSLSGPGPSLLESSPYFFQKKGVKPGS
jgi:hypothetical protein